MPRFKSTQNIFKDNKEEFSQNWLNNYSIEVPPYIQWDESRELSPEDIDLWEVITETAGPTGVYAAWLPYAEFYMIISSGSIDSTYYGKGSDLHAAKRCEELGITYPKK
jgi:hypothetical protein